MLKNKTLEPPLGQLPFHRIDANSIGHNGLPHRPLRQIRARGVALIPVLLLLLAGPGLSSCSWTDRNFSELRGRVTDWFDGEDDAAERDQAGQTRTSSNTNRYPNLSDIPDSSNLSADERRAAIQARLSGDPLVADTSGTQIDEATPSTASSSRLPTRLDSEISPLLQSSQSQTAPIIRGQNKPGPYGNAGNPTASAVTQIVPAHTGLGVIRPPLAERPFRAAPQNQAGSPATFIGSIFFGLGSIRLKSDDLSVIKQVAHVHRQRGGDVLIIAHASSRFRKASRIAARLGNFDLSLRRARAIRQALIRQGLRGKRIRIVARGDGEAQSAPNRPEIEAADRRADVFLVL